MYNYTNNELDEKIKECIDTFFKESNAEMVMLSDMGKLLKMEIREVLDLTYNNKVRNITSYIHKNHKNLSNFINTQTKYKIDNIENMSCILNN